MEYKLVALNIVRKIFNYEEINDTLFLKYHKKELELVKKVEKLIYKAKDIEEILYILEDFDKKIICNNLLFYNEYLNKLNNKLIFSLSEQEKYNLRENMIRSSNIKELYTKLEYFNSLLILNQKQLEENSSRDIEIDEKLLKEKIYEQTNLKIDDNLKICTRDKQNFELFKLITKLFRKIEEGNLTNIQAEYINQILTDKLQINYENLTNLFREQSNEIRNKI